MYPVLTFALVVQNPNCGRTKVGFSGCSAGRNSRAEPTEELFLFFDRWGGNRWMSVTGAWPQESLHHCLDFFLSLCLTSVTVCSTDSNLNQHNLDEGKKSHQEIHKMAAELFFLSPVFVPMVMMVNQFEDVSQDIKMCHGHSSCQSWISPPTKLEIMHETHVNLNIIWDSTDCLWYHQLLNYGLLHLPMGTFSWLCGNPGIIPRGNDNPEAICISSPVYLLTN